VIKQIRLLLRGRPILLTDWYDYRPNWIPLESLTQMIQNPTFSLDIPFLAMFLSKHFYPLGPNIIESYIFSAI